ncbi:small ubiquitin-related modifier 2-like [Prunus dulcis]|uniref:small ubiquitin-related modifier 2-like n=1 Tax=Prunus dulcis TaxID=3755 RepID=UPI0014823588|nr:small ubiquitin-related modifier 2-like [Prunus dulcis]
MGVGRRVPVGAQRNMLGVPKRPTRILLLVKDPWENFLMFRIKRSTQLKKLMIVYCDKKSVELDNMRFVHNGRLVRPNLTPDEHEMESGDVIYAFPVLLG